MKTGKVRFEYRDFPILSRPGGESWRAAEAAACALDQGQFWRYHDTLFLNQEGENQGAFSDSRLTAMAEAIGLDRDRFTSCMDDKTFEDEVQAMYDEAQQAGYNSTPTVVVNGQQLSRFDYPSLKAAIDQALGQ